MKGDFINLKTTKLLFNDEGANTYLEVQEFKNYQVTIQQFGKHMESLKWIYLKTTKLLFNWEDMKIR